MNYPDVKRRECYLWCNCLVWITLLTLALWTGQFPCAYAFLRKAELDLFNTEEENCLRTSAHNKRPQKVIIAFRYKQKELEVIFKLDRTLNPQFGYYPDTEC